MNSSRIHAVLTDIEGTTSSLAFVHDVLFPYARTHMADFIRAHAQDADVRALLDDVQTAVGRSLNQTALIEQLVRWIDEDRKVTPLKSLQGMIWEEGYKTGQFLGHIYEDAAQGLRRWHANGRRLYVFSSGSVPAQKLLFSHTAYGDLTPLFSGYFDTTTGAKREAASYLRIAQTIGMTPGEILFLSDIREELDAARDAGLHTAWLVRDALPKADAGHLQVRSFDDIHL